MTIQATNLQSNMYHCRMHWHITRYEAIFSVVNQLPVS